MLEEKKRPVVKIVGICGSLRKGSYSMQALQLATQRASALGADVKILDLKEMTLPFCDGGSDYLDYPDVETLRAAVTDADALILAGFALIWGALFFSARPAAGASGGRTSIGPSGAASASIRVEFSGLLHHYDVDFDGTMPDVEGVTIDVSNVDRRRSSRGKTYDVLAYVGAATTPGYAWTRTWLPHP